MADDPRILLQAIRQFGSSVGPDAHRYMDLRTVLRDRGLVELLQTGIEQSIAADLLPEFRFRNINRFLWHLENEEFARRYLFGSEIPIKHFRDHWIRRFLLPNRFDYLAEVAHALQANGEQARAFHEHEGQIRHHVSWLKVTQKWMAIRDTDRGYATGRRNPVLWRTYYPSLADNTIYRWAASAEAKRDSRHKSKPYNGWHISSILYLGGQLENVEIAHRTVGMVDTRYLEVWKWKPHPGCENPRRTSLSFMFPAAADTWKSPDRKFHPQFI